jgi:hypothetical protein
MYIPEISASKVAGLIGLHGYQDPNHVFYEILCKDKLIKARIADLEKAHHRRPFSVVLAEVLKEDSIKACIARGLSMCNSGVDLGNILQNVESQAKLSLLLRHDAFDEETRDLLAAEVRGQVAKQRGLRNEDAILNAYEVARDVKVTERNTRMVRKEYGKFRLLGRTDGYVESENRIVDSKDRTRAFAEVPLYDEIQMRCYMDMTGATEAELIERFPDGTTRHTKFLNDPVKWKGIQTAIETAVRRMNEVLGVPAELKRIVFANTVSIQQSNGDSSSEASTASVSKSKRNKL